MKTIYLSYSRVSTREQAMQGASIAAQIAEHDRFANDKDAVIEYYFSDDGYSAGSFDRPELQRLLKMISKNKQKNGEYDLHYILLVRYQNRLIRDIAKKRSLQCVFKTYNVEVVCMNGKWEGSPIDGGLATDIQMIFDENERTQISPRVIASYKQIAKEGCYPVGGNPPLGYKREKVGRSSKLVPDEATKDFVIWLFQTLSLNQYSVVELADRLRAQKILGRNWSDRSIYKIVNNTIYYGRLKMSWFDSLDIDLQCDRSGWYSDDTHTYPLISKNLWDTVQTAIHYKKKKEYHTYLFKGKVKCAICGEWLTLSSSYKRDRKGKTVFYQYYYCTHCNRRLNQKYIMEEVMWRYPAFERLTLSPEEISKMKNKLSIKQRRRKILNDLFDEGLISENSFIEEFQRLDKQISELKKEIEKVKKNKIRDFKGLSKILKKKFFEECIEEIWQCQYFCVNCFLSN
ncbi:recombinase family protein [Dubosiella newyorkensis]|uniref:recombinase family protein n=1 Tax=Dubosiella newyorkensis TaxID=1862672 RepID=UPI00272A50B7|nr:recombinase family protein [Dubosiella newyorkensis]